MRRIFCISLIGTFLAAWCTGQSNPFAGTWLNVAGYSSGELHRLVITSDSSGNNVHGYGSCSPSECDWGSVALTALAAFNGAPNPTGSYGVAKFSAITMSLRPDGPRLIVDVYDASVPNGAFHITEIMRKGPPTPAQMLPLDNTIFNNYPRTTVLTWQSSSEAVSYGVEIDVYDMCQDNAWCSDGGGPTTIVNGLTSPTYTFNFVGAQPGRWRVWAVNANGDQSPKSEWWNFVYAQ